MLAMALRIKYDKIFESIFFRHELITLKGGGGGGVLRSNLKNDHEIYPLILEEYN